MVGIAHNGIAFPVSPAVLPDEGGSSAEDHRRTLRRFFEIVDPEDIEVVLGDREFISTGWLRWLQDREIPFAVRLRSDRRIGLSPEGPSLPARMFARPLSAHTEKVLDGTRHLFGTDGEHVEVQVVMRRIAAPSSGEDQFLILATWGLDPDYVPNMRKAIRPRTNRLSSEPSGLFPTESERSRIIQARSIAAGTLSVRCFEDPLPGDHDPPCLRSGWGLQAHEVHAACEALRSQGHRVRLTCACLHVTQDLHSLAERIVERHHGWAILRHRKAKRGAGLYRMRTGGAQRERPLSLNSHHLW